MNWKKADCPVCKKDDAQDFYFIDSSTQLSCYVIRCPRCGEYTITDELCDRLKFEPSPKNRLSAWLRSRNESKTNIKRLDAKSIEELEGLLPDYSVPEKQNILLQNISRKSKWPGDEVELDLKNDLPLAWSGTDKEFRFYLKALEERGLLRNNSTMSTVSVVVTSLGWEYLEQHSLALEDKTQAFVAMSFSSEMKSIWENAIRPAIEKAGYKAYRVDMEPHNERIDTRIIAEIKNSRFVVADVTEQKHGVYFEAGFAMGLKMPVIWCVKKSDLADVHFDTRQYNHVVWKDEAELQDKLYYFVCAIVGKREK